MLGRHFAPATNVVCDLGQLASPLWVLYLSQLTDEGLGLLITTVVMATIY